MIDIAIIGISGKFPDADSKEELLQNLKSGWDSVNEVPLYRKLETNSNLDVSSIKLGSLNSIAQFDHNFFGVSQSEACNMNPHQRLGLEVIYNAVDDAGLNSEYFRKNKASFFISDFSLEYVDFIKEYNPTAFTGNGTSLFCGKVSRYFNFRGNSLVVNTSCSSSLVALELACNDLILKKSEVSVVGSVTLDVFSGVSKWGDVDPFEEIGIKADMGKTRAFSSKADGAGSGEAACAIVLKPLDKALEDNDNIHCVIKAIVSNQNATRSSSLTAPSPSAQAELLKEAWSQAEVNPLKMSYIITHGTGTNLGDPIEIQGLDMAFSEFSKEKGICDVVSLKSNLGHTWASSGLTSLFSGILSLQNKMIFESIHASPPNEMIDFENSSIKVNKSLKNWKSTDKRIMGISSFGMSGTNSHLILEEAPNDKRVIKKENEVIINISGKDEEGVLRNALELKKYLIANTNAKLEDVAYSLLRRTQHQFNACFGANSINDCIKKLDEVNGIKLKEEKVIILALSNDITYSKDVVNQLRKFTKINSFYEECLELSHERNNDDSFVRFATQYSIYKFLNSVGVKFSTIIASGESNALLEVIVNGKPLEKGLESLFNNESKPIAVDFFDKVKNFLEERENEVVLDLGLGGVFSKVTEKTGSQLLTYDTKSNIISNILSELIHITSLNLELISKSLLEKAKVISLPSYSFSSNYSWARAEPIKDINYIDDWTYELSWSKEGNYDSESEVDFTEKNTIILASEEQMRLPFVQKAILTSKTYLIITEGSLIENSNNSITIDWNNYNPNKLIERITKDFDHIDLVINLTGLELEEKICSENVDDLLHEKYFLLIECFKSIEFKLSPEAMIIHCLLYNDENPKKNIVSNAASTFVKCLKFDYPKLITRVISIDKGILNSEVESCISSSINQDHFIVERLYKNKEYYVPYLTKKKISSSVYSFKSNKTYIVVGGLKGIGYATSSLIAGISNANIVIIGRKDLNEVNDPKEWLFKNNKSNKLHSYVQNLYQLKRSGNNISYYNTDVGNKVEFTKLIDKLFDIHPSIEGVFYGAGVGAKHENISEKSIKDIQTVLSPKVNGLINLKTALKNKNINFLTIYSSGNSVIPQALGFEYCFGNRFEDLYSPELNEKQYKVFNINWGIWSEVGMAVATEGSAESAISLKTSEGLKLLLKILASKPGQYFIGNNLYKAYGDNPFIKIEETTAPLFSESKINDKASSEDQIKSELSSREIRDIISSIWNDVIVGIDVDDNDDFFDIGGDSLDGGQIMTEIQRQIGIKLSFSDLMSYTTVSKLSDFIYSTINKDLSDNQKEDIPKLEDAQYYEVSHSQKRMWIEDQLLTKKETLNLSAAFTIKGELNIEIFEKALRVIVDRNEVLRTSFKLEDQKIVQTVNGVPKQILNIKNLEYSKLSSDDINKKIQSIISQPFSLEFGPVFRFEIFIESNTKALFVMSFHHITTDLHSDKLFRIDLFTAYNQLLNNEIINDSDLNLQYKDFASWQNARIKTDDYKIQEKYWLNQLSVLPKELVLDSDFARGDNKSLEMSECRIKLDGEAESKIEDFCKKNEMTLYMFGISITYLLLRKLTGNKDIIIGSPVAGRNHPDLNKIIGNFLNLVPIRISLEESDSLNNLLAFVKQQVLNAMDNQDYPFNKTIEILKEKQILGDESSPVFQTMYVQQNAAQKEVLKMPKGLNIENYPINNYSAKYDLSVFFNEYGEFYELNFIYRSDLFEELTVMYWSTLFRNFVKNLIKDPKITLAELLSSEHIEIVEESENDDFNFDF